MEESRGFYDTNVLIAYLFREENRFDIARNVLRRHATRALSIISIHEIHMFSIKLGVETKFLDIKTLLDKLFRIEPLNQSICIKASHLRKTYKLPEIDSLVLATVVCLKYKHFYTFDRDFKELNNNVVEETLIHYLT